ncbi:MAG: hypothetical protein ACTSR7_03850 [Promethearchaeota archaeon]
MTVSALGVPCSIPVAFMTLMIFSMFYLDSISCEWDLVLLQEIAVRVVKEELPLFILGCFIISTLPLAYFLVDNIGTRRATEHLYVKYQGSIYLSGKRVSHELFFYISLLLQGHDKDKSIDEILAPIKDDKDLENNPVITYSDSRIKGIKSRDIPKKASTLLKKWNENDYDTKMKLLM